LRNILATSSRRISKASLQDLEANKMIVKIYGLVWLLGVLAVGVLYLTGNFTPSVSVLFGFLSFGAIFLGMIGVLPLTVAHPAPDKH
jgi:hypothetical protein